MMSYISFVLISVYSLNFLLCSINGASGVDSAVEITTLSTIINNSVPTTISLFTSTITPAVTAKSTNDAAKNTDKVLESMVVYQLSGTLNLIDALQLDLPAHLIVASDAARKSYFEIQQNPNIKKSLKNKALKSWAHEQSDAVSSLYDKYLTNLETQNNSHKEKIAECIKNIPDAGQQANLKIQQILDNNDITQKQEQTMINAILSPLNGSIVASLMDINQRCG